MSSTYRVGIDVGGTFTHAVAIDNATLKVVAHQVTPTSHSAEEGVARGILEAFASLQRQLPEGHRIVFLAHSTTQATNALLEGDVARVGIVGLGSGLEAVKAKADMAVGDIELSPGKFLRSGLEFVAPDADLTPAIERHKEAGAGAIVAAEGFSVDDPRGELRVMEAARQAGLPACGTHEMSGLYGLRVRTRTAVLNASILPKMIQTAEMTGQALRRQEVDAPLMVMRSDGGVMSLDEVRRRPVMTLLSGPAAGVAAALMFLKASDAIFLEVGGTSTDICLVKDGRAAVKSAQIGGHPTYLKTLDSRTLGIAGGSMIGPGSDGLEVGPRSAHLAGFPYASFAEPLQGALKVVEVRPLADDPVYFVVEDECGRKVAPTTTCAANLLGYIKPGDYAAGNLEAIRAVFEALARKLGGSADEVARQVLERAANKVLPTVKQLIEEYKVSDRALKLLGGGGGAGAIVAYLAEKMQLPFEIAERAEVVSAIGAALAMVKETIEKNIVNPSQEDLAQLRAAAEKAVVAMGADPTTVEVTVEVDSQKNLVRASATGSVEFVAQDLLETDPGPEERLATLKEAAPKEQSYTPLGQTDFYYLYRSDREERYLFNLMRRTKSTIWVTDGRGNVKLQVPGGKVQQSVGERMLDSLKQVLAQHTQYGDAGAIIPAVHVVAGRKLADLTALTAAEQAVALAREELKTISTAEPIYFLIHPPS
ncbi:MAG: hydantoinase/oxoprolinase family protein [Candidatus Eremiobacteraeota bacterium]|nr:hydantoinase/oxoprolinase family protein [Candidatus Eremiobacteraeota bacterium]